jgi:glycosyltransferase involved in cell wall biosynthesis
MNRKIKICHIQLLPLMSGVQRSMLYILQALDRNQYDVHVICKEEGDLTRTLKQLGIHIILLPNLVRTIHPLQDSVALFKLLKLFKKYKFDIVHTHSSKTGFLGRLAARLSGTEKILHSVHGLPFHEFSPSPVRFIYTWLERFGSLMSDKIIFVNNEERLMAIQKRLVREQKAITVYNGIDFDEVSTHDKKALRGRIRNRCGIRTNDFVVGYVGRLWRQKDPDTLMRIIDMCSERPYRFLIVGDGPYSLKFEELARINKNILLTGWVDDPFSYYPAMDLLVLPSLWEGLSMTLLEAMAFGKPVVASDIKGNRECIETGANGVLCTPRNALQFTAAIDKIADDKKLYKHLSDNARKNSRLFFNAAKNNKIIINLYQN